VTEEDERPEAADFERLARERRRGLLAEFWAFLRQNKKWWLVPLLVVMGLMGLLVFLSASGLAPFLYPLF
jgi:hypothetical protein